MPSVTYRLAVLPAFLLLTLAGCASTPPKPPEPTQVEKRLLQSSEGIQSMLAEVLRRERAAPSHAGGEIVVPNELLARFEVKWRGDIRPLLESITQEAGVPFVISGRRTGMIPVVIQSANGTLFDVLRDAGVQAGNRADVVISDRGIELRYLAPQVAQ